MFDLKRWSRFAEVAIVLALVLMGAAVVPASLALRYKAREGEVKDGLHRIQLEVEKLAVDTEGAYPRFLVGGAPRWSAQVDPAAGQPFNGEQASPDLKRVADPLLAKGYLTAYPRNPFALGAAVHQAQLKLPINAPGGDPLRNGNADGLAYGTRFGPRCTLMGQVLGARSYFWSPDKPQFGPQTLYRLPPGAATTYPCWDTWNRSRGPNLLPGDFFYSASGPIVVVGGVEGEPRPVLPSESDQYILGAFGGPHTKGRDVFDADGSPYMATPASPATGGNEQLGYGAPDGIRDGIILVLTAGEDYAEARN